MAALRFPASIGGVMKDPALARIPLLLGLSLALVCAAAAARAAPGEPAAGEAAPDFSARNFLTHDTVKLSDEQGKLVLLTFWATWCGPCRRELPVLEGVQKKLGPTQVRVLAVSFHENDETAVRAWAHKNALQLTLLEDPGEHIARKYATRAIPHLFIIGPDGRIIKVHTGYGEHSIEELVADINEALRAMGQAPAAAAATPATD
jgi:peroxiredoxin